HGLRGLEHRRCEQVAAVHAYHAADDLPVHLHLVDPDDDLLRERLPDHLPADRRRAGRLDDIAGRARLPHRVPELPGRARCGDRLHHDAQPGRRVRGPLPPDPEGGALMAILHETVAAHPTAVTHEAREKGVRGQWWRFAAILLITAVVLVPVAAVVLLSLRPGATSTSTATVTFSNFVYVFTSTSTLTWLGNSLAVTLATVVVSVAVAAPAGYVLSR